MSKTRWLAISALLAGGYVFQILPSGCAQFSFQAFLTGVNFCGIFNCGQGAFFNFCDPTLLLVDCP
jgi:hypothetical protein